MTATRQDNIAKAASGKLRAFFERLDKLNEKIEVLNADKSNLWSEAKSAGFDTKIMRVVMSRRQMDRVAVEERDALVKLYEDALRGSGTKVATRARAQGDAGDDDE